MAKMTDRHKAVAFLLNKEMGYTQVDIAKLMKISQSTVANACKEISFRISIQNLERELKEAREIIQMSDLTKKPVLFLEEN